MRRLFFIFLLVFTSTIAFSQWDDDYGTTAPRKQGKNSSTASREGNSIGRNSYRDYDDSYYTENQYYSGSQKLPNLSSDAKEALIESFDAALQRRIFAMKSTTDHDESYWEIMEAYYRFLRNSYDKNLYNVISLNDQIWVEPQYITAMFNGSDPAQGVNDYVEVVLKEKKYEARKKNEQYSRQNYTRAGGYWNGWHVGFGWGWGSPWFDPFWDPWWGPFSPWYDPWPYSPWGPWGPWRPGPYRPWGPWGPWGPWQRPIIVIGNTHPVYYGNGHRGVFSPSPSLRSPGINKESMQGSPFGRGGVGSPDRSKTPEPRINNGDRNYRNNTNQRPNVTNYRSNSPSPSPGGMPGGMPSGGGFHSIGGGGYRR